VKRESLREAELLQMELARFDIWIPFLDILQKLGGLTWLQADQVRKTEFDKLLSSQAWKEEAVPGYRVVNKIASGSFATIFAADPVFGGKRVALKVLHADRVSDADAVARFRREAALLMKLRHPSIVHGFDLSEHGGAHYLSMELVDGDSLERAVYEGRGLNSLRALGVLRQVAVALKHLLAEGYVHRDVKPSNILLAKDGTAKLCDLGLVEEAKTGIESDLYSLGVTLFYMLSANARFAGPASSEVLAARFVSGRDEVDPASLRAPGPIVDLLGRLVHRERAKRVQGYVELLREIEACAEALRR
jgi:serine/threonine-protein kinase